MSHPLRSPTRLPAPAVPRAGAHVLARTLLELRRAAALTRPLLVRGTTGEPPAGCRARSPAAPAIEFAPLRSASVRHLRQAPDTKGRVARAPPPCPHSPPIALGRIGAPA